MKRSPIKQAILLLTMILVSIMACGSAAETKESLHKAINKTDDVGSKIKLYMDLAELFKDSSADSSMMYLDKARSMFWRINSLPYLGKNYEIRGDLARQSNDFINATRFFKTAIFCYEKTNEKEKQIRLLNIVGSSYAQSGNVAEAFRYYLKAREYASEFQDLDMLARIDNNLGRLYCTSENYHTGIEFYKKALTAFEKGKDAFKTGNVCMNLGNAFFHISLMDSSRAYAKRARMLFNTINKKYYEATSLQTIAFTLISEKRFPEALTYLDSVRSIASAKGTGAELIESKFLLSDVLVFTGITHCMMGDYRFGKTFLLTGLHISDSLGMLERSMNALQYLAIAYDKTSQVDSAFFYHKRFKTASDSLMKIQSINIVKLAEVQMDYEEEVKEKKMQLAYNKVLQKRNLIIFIGAGAILLALVLLLVLKLRIEKQKKMQAEIEKKQAELEKQTADIQLESQKKELTLNVISLIRKNEMILDLSNRLIRIKESMVDEKAGSEIVQLVNTMQKSTDDSVWEEFELRFKQVHTNFYDRLIAQFPDLTPSELKLCALLKLNLSNKEISELSGQRAATLEVARYRLRKKLGISNSQVNLVTFLSQI